MNVELFFNMDAQIYTNPIMFSGICALTNRVVALINSRS